MKPTEDWNEPDLDAQFFRYVEGELTARESAEWADKLAADADLRNELAYWQDTVLAPEPEAYDTRHLEAQLLRTEVPVSRSTGAGAVFWVTLTVLLFTGYSRTGKWAQPVLPHMAVESRQPATVPPAREELPTSLLAFTAPRRTQRPPIAPPAEEDQSPGLRILQMEPVLARLAIMPTTQATAPEWKVEKPKIKRIVLPKQLTRKERRALVRLKEKARQQRQADEFLKGRVPYVVPLNTKDF